MKIPLILLSIIFILFSCSNNFEMTKENVENTYKLENRSLNLVNKDIANFVNLNKYMSWTEVNNIFLWNNRIQLIDVSGFNKLWTLEINNNNIRFISDLRLPLTIRNLNISNNNLTNLKWIEKYLKLKIIDISNNKLDDKSLILLKSLKNLKYINIEWNDISEKILEEIKAFNSTYLSNNKKPFSTLEK